MESHIFSFQMAIAYFPLVILVSGVFASFGGKKLNKLLGNKVNTTFEVRLEKLTSGRQHRSQEVYIV